MHRDIKPTNFLYDPDTRTGLLIDFGLSEIEMDHVSGNPRNPKHKDKIQIDLLVLSRMNLLLGIDQINTGSCLCFAQYRI